ncbi:MAG: DUF3800 domain-containing protein [Woeseia sp.]
MLVFIDESGCPGFKLDRGSSPYFVFAMVVFESPPEAEIVDRQIDQIRSIAKHRGEFKFSKCCASVRDEFCQSVASFDFVVRAIVVDKKQINSSVLRSRTESFYNYFVKMMMEHDGKLLRNAIVKIDESGDRKFKSELARYLQNHVGRDRIKKVRFVNSRNNNLIQLADMAAGAIHRACRNDSRQNDRWRKQLRRRIADVWTFPNPGH